MASAAMVGLGASAGAATVTWTSTSSGLWGENSRWSSNPSLPGVNDDVVIDVANQNVLVTIKTSVFSVKSVTSNEGLFIESGGLSVAANSIVNGAFTLSGGILSGAGNFTLAGASTWINNTTMDGTGKTIVAATGAMTITPGNYNKVLKRNLENFGSITLDGSMPFAAIQMTDATIFNRAGATFNVDNSAFAASFYGDAGNNTFLNEGTFNKTGSGTVQFSNGAGSTPVALVNAGQVNVQGGTVLLQTAATHSGHFTLSAGTTLELQTSQSFTSTGGVTGAGTLFYNHAGTNVSDGVINVSGTILFAGGTNTFNAALTAGQFQANNGGTFTFNGPATIGQLTVTNANIGGSGDISISGSSKWTGFGTMSGSGKTIITAGSSFMFASSGSPKDIQRSFVNFGTVNWNGTGPIATLNLTNALFENRAGATFNVNGDQYSFFGASGTNAFANAGLFQKITSGSATFGGAGTASAVAFSNSGTMSVSAGLLQFDGSFANSGNVTLSGGTMTLSAGLNNTGAIQVSGGAVLNLGGIISTSQLGNWQNAGGQVNLTGILNNASATLTLTDTTGPLRLLAGSKIIGGTLATTGTSRVEIVGASTIDGPTLSGNVRLFQQAGLTILTGVDLGGGVLTLDASGASTVTFTGSTTIGGTGQVTTAGGTGSAATLMASAGGDLTFGPGVFAHPTTRDLLIGSSNSAVINQGTMAADLAGTLLTVAGTAVTNLGTFKAKNGGTLLVSGALTNLSNGTLTGGAWRVSGNSALRLQGGSIVNNAALVVLDGAASDIFSGATGTNSALAALAQNTATGDLSILNGRSLTTTGDFVNNGKLTIGAGSAWTTPTTFTNNGTVTASGTLSSGKTTVDGFFTLSSGTHTVSGDMVVGSGRNDARYDITGGTLAVGGFTTVGSGPVGAGVFNLSAGSLTAGKQLYISTAGTNLSTFNLSGGSITAGELFVAFFGGAKGVFNQTGGTVTLAGNTAVGTTGALTLGFSSLAGTSGTYNLSAGTLSDAAVQVGYSGNDVFNQGGGTHNITGVGGLSLGLFTGGSGTYSMSNGATLNVSADETVGAYGSATFNQTGGTHNVSGTVKLGAYPGAFGTFNLSGGTLTASLVDLKQGIFNQTGGKLNTLNFLQDGGEARGTVEASTNFTYISGLFTGRLINSGTAVLYANFTAGNGMENRGQFDVAGNRTVTLNGAGLTNDGAMELTGTLASASVRIGQNANGVLTHSSGTHTVSGNLYVGYGAGKTGGYALQSGTLNVTGTTYVGFDGGGTFTHAGGNHSAGALVIAANGGSSGTYTMSAGSVTATSTANNGAYTQTGGTATLGNVSGTGSMTVSGGTVAATTIRQDALTVDNAGLVNLALGGGASRVKSLGVPVGSGITAAIDLGNNTFIVDYTGPSVLAQVRGMLTAGYGNSPGHWDGSGIRSSAAAGDPTLGLGVAEAADVLHISGEQTATFDGVTVDATSVLIKLTKIGDTNLDGAVGFGDFQRLELGFGEAGGNWLNGDFNFDGAVDETDFVALYHNYGQTLGAPAAPVSAAEAQMLAVYATSVPEPIGAGALAITAGAAMLRRRRRA